MLFTTHIISYAHVYDAVLADIVKKIASMGICELVVMLRYFLHDLLGYLCKVSSTGSIFGQHNCAPRDHTVQYWHLYNENWINNKESVAAYIEGTHLALFHLLYYSVFVFSEILW